MSGFNLYQRAFVYHAPTFSTGISGFAKCRVCGWHFTSEQLFDERCPGPQPERPVPPPTPACAFCRAPLVVAPRHRETVALFGSLCNACAWVEAAVYA